ncbi:MAG: hypothetical protein WCA46_13425 [Actinocatenispora sp.]
MIKKILTWGGLAFVIFFIAYKPNSAATVAKTLGGGIVNILTGVGNFFSSLVG